MHINITNNQGVSKIVKPWTKDEHNLMAQLTKDYADNGLPVSKAFEKVAAKIGRTKDAVSYRYYNYFGNSVKKRTMKYRNSANNTAQAPNSEDLVFITVKRLFQKLSQQQKIEIISSHL